MFAYFWYSVSKIHTSQRHMWSKANSGIAKLKSDEYIPCLNHLLNIIY